ncbi:MAG TPA: hypothetical protein VLF71_01765 [Candidatus Saccharimonadales bacterium]|nr:hypothetical protein [Candidatus Saccharimonadales bacterium]
MRTSDPLSPRVTFVTAPEEGSPDNWLGRDVNGAANTELDLGTGVLVARNATLLTPKQNVLDVTMSLTNPELASTVGGFTLNITDVTFF